MLVRLVSDARRWRWLMLAIACLLAFNTLAVNPEWKVQPDPPTAAFKPKLSGFAPLPVWLVDNVTVLQAGSPLVAIRGTVNGHPNPSRWFIYDLRTGVAKSTPADLTENTHQALVSPDGTYFATYDVNSVLRMRVLQGNDLLGSPRPP